jgi:hypothetical protein
MKRINPIIALLLFSLVFAASCRKDKAPKGIVRVVNLKGEAVAGAAVLMHAHDIPAKPGDYEFKGETDAAGEFLMEAKYEGIYTIDAAKDTLTGYNRIKLEKNKTIEQTVILQ